MEEPRPIGDSIEEVLDGILPEHIAQARVRFLVEHADEVLQLRDAHKRVWEEMLGHEVRVMVLDGLSPRLAEAAAKNNLAVRKQDLDAELEVGLQRLSGDLQRKMQRLMEEMQTEEE